MSKRPSYERRECGKLSFVCLDTYRGSNLLRLTAPSAENWAVREALSAASQGLTPSPPCPGVRSKVWWAGLCQPAKRALTILMSDDTSIHHLVHPSIRGPILSKPSLPQNTPILIYIRSFVMTLWLYMGLCLAVHVPSPLPAGPH